MVQLLLLSGIYGVSPSSRRACVWFRTNIHTKWINLLTTDWAAKSETVRSMLWWTVKRVVTYGLGCYPSAELLVGIEHVDPILTLRGIHWLFNNDNGPLDVGQLVQLVCLFRLALRTYWVVTWIPAAILVQFDEMSYAAEGEMEIVWQIFIIQGYALLFAVTRFMFRIIIYVSPRNWAHLFCLLPFLFPSACSRTIVHEPTSDIRECALNWTPNSDNSDKFRFVFGMSKGENGEISIRM